MSITLQETFDRFLLHTQDHEESTPDTMRQHEQTFTLLSEYLIYYSDLFQAENTEEAAVAQDWEESLDNFITQLMQGEHEHPPSLEELPLDRIGGEYLRDFIGWHLLREPTIDSLMVEDCAKTLLAWLTFVHQKQWIDTPHFEQASATLQDTLPDAKRAAIAAHLLLYHIRLGGGVSPRLRGKRFKAFKEGHARIANIEPAALWLSFDSDPETFIGPITLPDTILQYLHTGDVIDIELGQRDDIWNIVDIGPVYPAVVYVEAEEMELMDKRI